jgi:hypothetical protein
MIEYILKHHDIAVALLEFTDNGMFNKIKEIINKEHTPLGIIDEAGKINHKRYGKWWNDRGIPEDREDLREVLQELGEYSKQIVLIKSNGLSLTDHYWIDRVNGRLTWDDINFYDHEFPGDIGDLFFHHKKKKEYRIGGPDVTSNGVLKKRWVIEDDGKRVLLKGGKKPYRQEPYNEEIASMLCKRLSIPHVPYTVMEYGVDTVSRCANMTNNKEEYVDAYSIYTIRYENIFSGTNDGESHLYNHYKKCCSILNVPHVEQRCNEMMVLDYIINNVDRHFGNFGIIRDAESLGNIRVAPIFDSGTSLYCDENEHNIGREKELLGKYRCFQTLENQLQLVSDYSWIPMDTLVGADKECMDILHKNAEYIEKGRINKIGEVMRKRIAAIGLLAEGKREKERNAMNTVHGKKGIGW